ncbi:hypothetical protein GCM10009555_032080 [Acrocarpospora macrocephala]|uniref:Uncharacterized protein n=1 Tax=Acrocarpospora macrocephala TaxID=150177 RepID=A0A5M3WX81_9ACTN|nr:hypothetical protein Amac_061360 [Acrocarpospora macrocephala]
MLAALAACGTAATAPEPRYEADTFVLASQKHGPRLCVAIDFSLPPQCGGPDIAGWDWNGVEHSDRHGVRWGEYRVVGTWDGEKLTLTEPPRPAERPDSPPSRSRFTSPCPEPSGGWRPVAPAKATQQAIDAAITRAKKLPGYAGAWLDQSYLDEIEGYDSNDPRSVERYANDHERLVLNLRFTGDATTREPAIRELWGGALCLSQAQHTKKELQTLHGRASKEIKGVFSGWVDELKGQVEIGAWLATPELQHEVDEKYGKGLVVLHSFLRPVGL